MKPQTYEVKIEVDGRKVFARVLDYAGLSGELYHAQIDWADLSEPIEGSWSDGELLHVSYLFPYLTAGESQRIRDAVAEALLAVLPPLQQVEAPSPGEQVRELLRQGVVAAIAAGWEGDHIAQAIEELCFEEGWPGKEEKEEEGEEGLSVSASPTLVPLPSYGNHMMWEEFMENVADEMFIDDDGFGELATATHISGEFVSPSYAAQLKRPDWATHVVWYNR